jgi:hypothetical protein
MTRLIALFSLLAFAPCAHTRQVIYDCTKAEIIVPGRLIVIEVMDALARPDWTVALATLVVKHGAEVVACVVRSLSERLSAEPGEAPRAGRARQWLVEQKATFKD